MNFTREPIIETIISAREGYKLSLKSSKTAAGEEYLVDAIEVVSFGGSFFYRCVERAKPFFFPACDYEIVEVRETRLVLKTASLEKAIKIAGGKDSSRQQHRPQPVASEEDVELKASTEEMPVSAASPAPQEPKRDKKRYRKKKGGNREEKNFSAPSPQPIEAQGKEGGVIINTPSVFSHLLRPPESLISESLQKKYRKDDSVTAPEIASALASKTEEAISDWSKAEVNIFSEEIKADAELISEPPPPQDRLEEDTHQDSLLHLSFPEFDDRI